MIRLCLATCCSRIFARRVPKRTVSTGVSPRRRFDRHSARTAVHPPPQFQPRDPQHIVSPGDEVAPRLRPFSPR